MPKQCAITIQEVEDKVDSIISAMGEEFTSVRNEISVIDVDNSTRFEVSAVDNTTGPIAAGNITPGTITITRYRAGVATAIVTAAAMTAGTGKSYYDYTFAAANWATDDSYIAVISGFTFTIDGATCYPSISPWYGNVANMSSIEGKVDTVITGLIRKESQMVFWSDVQPSVVITGTAADLDFPSVVVPDIIPAGATITSVIALVKFRKQVDSSGSANAIAGASKTIRVKKSTGAWGTDDVVAIDVPNNTLSTDGSATEGGDIIVGDNDIKAEVDADNSTYNFRSEQTNRTDAIVVDAASLTLVDCQTALIIKWQ